MRVVADGLHLAECPRWHDGALWFSDMWGHTVHRVGADGRPEVVHRFDDGEEPGGLGFLPDGRVLVVGMTGRVVLRLPGDGTGRDHTELHADLTAFAEWPLNDMVVGADGTAYVSQFGFDLWGGTTGVAPTVVVRVTADGAAAVAADGLMSPNGMALTDDGRSLVVAEPAAFRLTRFTVADDGTLSDREVLADLPPAAGQTMAPPDGICLDAEGGVWAADPVGRRVLRVVRVGGAVSVTHELPFPDAHPLAVVLGGDDRRTLFVCLAGTYRKADRPAQPSSRVVAVPAPVPGAGRP